MKSSGSKAKHPKRRTLHHLCGILGEIKGPACPSAVASTITSTAESKNPKEYLLLGPARFVNHDCKPNAEILASGDHEINIKALRGTENGEEVTAKYGKAYFAPDYSTCLYGSCEIQSLKVALFKYSGAAKVTNVPLFLNTA